MSATTSSPNVLCFSGGQAGAAFVDQLARIVPAEQLTVVLNTGNNSLHGRDWEMPDIDLHLSVLADDPAAIAKIPAARNRLLGAGHTLTAAVRTLRTQFNIGPNLLPVSGKALPTQLVVDGEPHPLSAWVGAAPPAAASSLHYPDSARTTRSVMQAVQRANIMLLAPANPHLDLQPMLNAYPLQALLEDHPTAVIVGCLPYALPAWESRLLAQLQLPFDLASYIDRFSPLLDGCVIPETADAGGVIPELLLLRTSSPDTAQLARTAYELALDLCG